MIQKTQLLSYTLFFSILFTLTGILFIQTTNAQTPSINAQTPSLQPTQIITEQDIPQEYNTPFEFQWGGGSLSQLQARLATMNCMADVIWIYNNNQWRPYSEYSVPRDFYVNQQFIQQYEQFIPAGIAWADCYDTPVVVPTTPLPSLVDPTTLKQTEIVATIPTEYNTTFSLKWGGGSLFQLKGRLATMGCMVNNISFTDPETNREYTYNQYTTRSPERANKQFIQQYEQFIPAGELSADCYEVCNFWGIPAWCAPFEEIRANWDGGDLSAIKHSTCTNDFLPQVKEVVLRLLPMRPDVCVVRDLNHPTRDIGGYALANNLRQPFIFIHGADPTNDAYLTRTALHTEVHELCHINQHWHWLQKKSHANYYNGYDYIKYFNNSAHGKEFIDLIGFTSVYNNRSTLPTESIYRDIYSSNPFELSAELCAMYLTEKMGVESIYEYRTYDYFTRNSNNGYTRHPRREVDVNKYLTPEVREWLETYMILPDVR